MRNLFGLIIAGVCLLLFVSTCDGMTGKPKGLEGQVRALAKARGLKVTGGYLVVGVREGAFCGESDQGRFLGRSPDLHPSDSALIARSDLSREQFDALWAAWCK
jgi:hypothetical protein